MTRQRRAKALSIFSIALIVSVAFIVLFTVSPAQAVVTKNDYFETLTGSQTSFYDPYDRGQDFTATAAYSVSQIDLRGYRIGGTTYTLTIQIRATDVNGIPTGSALSTGTLSAASMPTSMNWFSVSMSAFNTVVGTKYAMLFWYNGPDYNNEVYLSINSNNAYTGGDYLNSADGGVTWNIPFAYDFNFRVWGTLLDSKAPTYSNLGYTGTANEGTAVTFSCLAADETNLGQYIFSYYNAVSWANDTAVNISGTSAWCNVTKTLPYTTSTIQGKWYLKDAQGNWNTTTAVSINPAALFCNTQQDQTDHRDRLALNTLYAYWYSNRYDLSQYCFGINSGSGFSNTSWTNFGATNNSWASYGLQLNYPLGTVITWRSYAKDSTGLAWLASPDQSFTVQATVTFYDSNGLIIVNGSAVSDGATVIYTSPTKLSIAGAPNSGYTWLSFNYTHTYGEGSSCLKLSGTSFGGDAYKNTPSACTAGDTFVFSGWVKSDSGIRLRLGIHFYTSGGSYISGLQGANYDGAQWSWASDTITAPATAASYRVAVFYIVTTGSSGSIYADGLTLTKNGSPVSLPNMGFESGLTDWAYEGTMITVATVNVTTSSTTNPSLFEIESASSITSSVTAALSPYIQAAFTYTPSNPDFGSYVTFNAGSSTSSSSITNYSWNFGDSNTTAGASYSSIIHKYAANGTYTVSLTVTSSAGSSMISSFVCYGYDPASWTAGNTSGWISGNQTGWISGNTTGYTAGYSAGYSAGYTAGYLTGWIQGNTTGFLAGFSSGNTSGYTLGYSIGWAAGNSSGFSAGYSVGYAAGQAYGFGLGYDSGYSAGNITGYNSGWIAGNLSGFNLGWTSGWAAGNSSGYNSGWATGNETGYSDGWAAGFLAGNNTGYDSGWISGNFTGWISGNQTGWINGWSQGNYTGYVDGYSIGWADGNATGFTMGWQEASGQIPSGLSDADSTIWAIVAAIFAAFFVGISAFVLLKRRP